MAGINHSTAQHCAAQHNTNINFPSAHNKYSLLLLLLFSACHIFPRPPSSLFSRLFSVLNTLHICCASSSANAFALPSVSSPSTFPLPSTCSFSNFPIENVLINMHNLNFEVVEREQKRQGQSESEGEGASVVCAIWLHKVGLPICNLGADSRRNRLRYSQ